MTNSQFAEESYKTKKVRKKLKKHLEKIDSQITQQELNRKIVEIHRWISRHAPHRISLKNKSISLFDENQNAAKCSQKIMGIISQLQKTFIALNSLQKS
jgi:lysyl-tRNA synthetase class I